MTKLENRCSNCSGKFGLVSYHHWGLRFCRKACKDAFLAKTVKDHARMRRWLGFLPRGVDGKTPDQSLATSERENRGMSQPDRV